MKKFVNRVSEDRKCSLCHLVLDNPVKTPCAHVFCSGCILPWVVCYKSCPLRCQTLGPSDLENVVALRDLVYNMKVVCDFKDQGCSEILKLRNLDLHMQQDCTLRPFKCRNKGCECQVAFKDITEHEARECHFKPTGICPKGCGLLLLQNSPENHDCVSALVEKVSEQETLITRLEQDLVAVTSKLHGRERVLLERISTLTKELQAQAMKFQNQWRNYQTQMDQMLTVTNDNDDCDNKVISWVIYLYLRGWTGGTPFPVPSPFSPSSLPLLPHFPPPSPPLPSPYQLFPSP